MKTARTAAIIGLNWGLVHLRGLREAGCEVVALASADEGRAREIAQREAVPVGTADVGALNRVDLVVVAVPADSHAGVLRQLPDPFLICEKPLIGLRTPTSELPDTSGRMFVNYAFGFLQTAAAVERILQQQPAPHRVLLQVAVHLPLSFSSTQWFLETASHPLSWLLHLFGEPELRSRSIGADRVALHLVAGSTDVDVLMTIGGQEGIAQRIEFHWPDHRLLVTGQYRPGRLWTYDAVTFDGHAVNEGEWSASDCWLDANAASVGTMISVFRGERSWSQGLDLGLFDAPRALWLERVIR